MSVYNHGAEIVMSNPLNILGNRQLLERLTHDARENGLSHAYIIDGKPGSGRHTIARHLALALACHQRPNRQPTDREQMGFFDDLPPEPTDPNAPFPCGVCEGCRKVLEDICPDIRMIGREGKATLGVDTIRKIREDVYLSPGDMDTKIYIIEDAETMTPQAQNALLLTLEEPPTYVLFLLLCNGADHLLETIRSRAPVLHTTPLSNEELRLCLSQHKRSLPAEELETVLLCADGCAGQALALSEPKALKSMLKLRLLVDAFMDGCANRGSGAASAVIQQFGNKRDEVMGILRLISLAVRDLMLLKKSENAVLRYYIHRETALELSAVFTSKNLLNLYQALEQAQEDLARNANVRLTLTQACFHAGVM